jgi:hypothetical protein
MQPQPGLDLGINYGELLAGALLWTVCGLIVAPVCALLLHWAGHAMGVFRLKREEQPPKFHWSLALLGALIAFIVGGWTGCKVGVVRAGVDAVVTAGPKLLRSGLEQGLLAAGMTNFAGLEVKRLHELLGQAEKFDLVPEDLKDAEELRPYLDQWRPQLEEARRVAIAQARAFLRDHVKLEKLSLTELVDALLPKFTLQLERWAREFTRWEITTAVMWIVGAEVFLALACLAVRCLRGKPKPAPPPPPRAPPSPPPVLPPKLESA